MDSSSEPSWAASDSLLGLLQRGRGDGYTGSLAQASEARHLVLNCVQHDPRWDHQVEDRGWYYASLVLALGIEATAVLPSMETGPDPTGDDRFWIATEVLSLCAHKGLPGAVSELRRYLRSGRDLDLAVNNLVPFAAHAEAVGLVEELFAVADPDALESAFVWAPADFDLPPWPALRRTDPALDEVVRSSLDRRANPPGPAVKAHISRVLNLWNVVGPPRLEPQVGDRGETTAQLIEAADRQPAYAVGIAQALRNRTSATDKALIVATARSGAEGSRAAALMALGEQDDDLLLDIGLPLLSGTDDPDRLQRAVLRGLRRLRSGRALGWARASALDLAGGSAARAVLAANAVESDLPQLRSLLDWASERDAIYDQCSLVDALRRHGDTAAVGQIAALYESTVYSYLRRRCTLALAALHPAFPESLAVEALWDCEAETRLCGIERAALSDRVRKRLRVIAGDTIEDLRTRQAAESRLA